MTKIGFTESKEVFTKQLENFELKADFKKEELVYPNDLTINEKQTCNFSSNENFVVPDVAAQDNYIACSFTVKSEIVVPLFVNGINIGQIDIDSHVLDPFTAEDERFLEFVNQEVGKLFL